MAAGWCMGPRGGSERTDRERERMGLGSNTVHTRERRGEAVVAAVASQRAREKGGPRGIRGADTVHTRERSVSPRERDDERGWARGVRVAKRAWLVKWQVGLRGGAEGLREKHTEGGAPAGAEGVGARAGEAWQW